MFQTQKIIAAAFAASLLTLTAMPSAFAVVPYLTDSSGDIAKDSDGDCWRTGLWTPETAVQECDPELFAEAEPEPVEVIETAAFTEPEPEPAPVVRQVLLEENALFAFDSSEITEQGRSAISTLADELREVEGIESVEIGGHTDSIGPETYNQQLSERRANSVKEQLIQEGIPADLILTHGYGETRPRADNSTNEGRQMNRRSEIDIRARKVVE